MLMAHNLYVFKNFRKNQRNRIVIDLHKMANYQEAIVKLTNTQLNKLKSAAKNNTGTTLKITKKIFQNEELPQELILTTGKITKIRNTFASNMSTNIKIIKSQLDKIIQSGGFLCSWLNKLGKKKVVTDLAIPFARDKLPGLVSNAASKRIISGKETVRTGKVFTLIISSEDIDDFIKVVMPLEDSGVLIDGVTEAVIHQIKKQEGEFLAALLAPLAASVVQPIISSVVKRITGRGVLKAGRGYMIL